MASMSELTAFERFKERVIGKVDAARGQCWLFHQWGRWEKLREGQASIETRVIGFWFYQERKCHRCGKVESDMVTKT